jgi:hypothetical protein
VTLDLDLLPGDYAICRLAPGEPTPEWVPSAGVVSWTRTSAELSIVCAADAVPRGVVCESPWRVLAVRGPLDLALTGVLASLTSPLATAAVSIFAISTYDTDYVLVRAADVDRAVKALRHAGHHVG